MTSEATVQMNCQKLDATMMSPVKIGFNADPSRRNEWYSAQDFRQLWSQVSSVPDLNNSMARSIGEVASLEGIGREMYQLFVKEGGVFYVNTDGCIARYNNQRTQIRLNYQLYKCDEGQVKVVIGGKDNLNQIGHELAHHVDFNKKDENYRLSQTTLFSECVNLDRVLRADKGIMSWVDNLTGRLYSGYSPKCGNLLEPFANLLAMHADGGYRPESPILDAYVENIVRTEILIRLQLGVVEGKRALDALHEAGKCGLPSGCFVMRNEKVGVEYLNHVGKTIREKFGVVEVPLMNMRPPAMSR